MFKKIMRWSMGKFTPEELYTIGEKVFVSEKIKSKKPERNDVLKIENLMLRYENRRLQTRFILSKKY